MYIFFILFTLSDTTLRRGHRKHLRSDHTQTSNNTTILYYHEAKKSSFEETDTNLVEEDDANNTSLDEVEDYRFQFNVQASKLKNFRNILSVHRWKKRIPSSKFGEIIKAQGKYSSDLTSRLSEFKGGSI